MIDHGNGLDRVRNVAITGDRIVRVAPIIDLEERHPWIDAAGKLPVPSMIGLHAHVYHREDPQRHRPGPGGG